MRVTCDRICRMVIAKPKADYGCSFSPGEKARMRASVKPKFRVAGLVCCKKKLYAPPHPGPLPQLCWRRRRNIHRLHENSRGLMSLATCHLSLGLYSRPVSRKHKRIAALVEQHHGHTLDRHYVGYFDCFNRQLFYEAHEVLEHIWLQDRHGPNGAFYKGLIQLAGAFVHLQRNRPGPAAALFRLASANIEKYPDQHERLDVAAVRHLIANWLDRLQSPGLGTDPLTAANAPRISLVPAT